MEGIDVASLPYMQFYVADYLADTRHLNPTQHGMYLLLIMNYWQTGKPLPNNDAMLARIIGVRKQEFVKNRESLSHFFVLTETQWRHRRIDCDLKAAYEKSIKASSSAMQRYQKDTANAEPTHSERNADALLQDKIILDNTPLPPRGGVGRFEEIVDAFKSLKGATVDVNRAERLWGSMKLDCRADEIIIAIGQYALTEQWKRGAIPSLASFLSGGSWKILPKLPYGAKSGLT